MTATTQALPTLSDDEREILCRFMQGSLQLMDNGDFAASIFGRGPTFGEPLPDEYREEERNEDGYLHSRVEQDWVRPIFGKLFPGRQVYEFRDDS